MNDDARTELSGVSIVQKYMNEAHQELRLRVISDLNATLMLDVIKEYLKPDSYLEARYALAQAMHQTKRSFFSQEEIATMARDAIALLNSVREPT